jgi:hypothetical protein
VPEHKDGEEKRSGTLWVGISSGRERKWKVGRGLYIIRERLQTALNVTDVRRIVHSTYIYRTILSL